MLHWIVHHLVLSLSPFEAVLLVRYQCTQIISAQSLNYFSIRAEDVALSPPRILKYLRERERAFNAWYSRSFPAFTFESQNSILYSAVPLCPMRGHDLLQQQQWQSTAASTHTKANGSNRGEHRCSSSSSSSSSRSNTLSCQLTHTLSQRRSRSRRDVHREWPLALDRATKHNRQRLTNHRYEPN